MKTGYDERDIKEAVLGWLEWVGLPKERVTSVEIEGAGTMKLAVVATLASNVTLDAATTAADTFSRNATDFAAFLTEKGIGNLVRFYASEVQPILTGAPVDDASANANKAATIAGAIVGGIAGLVVLYLLFELFLRDRQDEPGATAYVAGAHASKAGGGGGGGEANEPSFGMSSMGSRKDSWVNESAVEAAEDTIRETRFAETGHISFTQKKQPEWLNQYRYETANSAAAAGGGGNGTKDGRRSSDGYSKGSGFAETQLNAAIPGAVEVEEETETVAVQLLRTKLEQGAIDRLEFEHIRAVMLRSMALTDGDQVPTAVAITDV